MITIIIPTIGRSSTIKESIESAIACGSNYVEEILIADNSQNSDFAFMLSNYIKMDARIRIIKYERRVNMATSWNVATNEARGKWVLYLHDDDVLCSENMDKAAQCIFPDAGFVYCDFNVNNKGKTYKWRYNQKDSLTAIVTFCPRFVSTIINKEALSEVGGWDENNGYALDFVAFMMIARKRQVIYCNYTLGSYRIHEENFSSKDRRNKEYGDSLGHVIDKLFMEYKDEETRRRILILLTSFIYPLPDTVVYRIARKLARMIKSRLILE